MPETLAETSSPPAPETVLVRFIGSTTSIGIYTVSQFGQAISLPVSLLRDAILGGSAVLPAPLFDSCGFTDEELERWPEHAEHASFEPHPLTGKQEWIQNAPDEFMAKKKKALLLLHEYRQKLQEDESNMPPAEVPDSFLVKSTPEAAQNPVPTPKAVKVPNAVFEPAPVLSPVEVSEI